MAGGTVEVLGRPAGSSDLRNRVGYVTQAPSVYGDLPWARISDYFARVVGVSRNGSRRPSKRSALRVHRKAGLLALGRATGPGSLASALLNKPDLLVLDGPRSASIPARAELWKTFHELAEVAPPCWFPVTSWTRPALRSPDSDSRRTPAAPHDARSTAPGNRRERPRPRLPQGDRVGRGGGVSPRITPGHRPQGPAGRSGTIPGRSPSCCSFRPFSSP